MPLIDARRLDPGSSIEADICIVGAGAAGITLARELIGSDLKVAVLESGNFDFRHPPQCLYVGENVGLDSFSLARSRYRMFGGSMTRWAGQCAPLEAIDFQQRDWIPYSGWPFDKAHLDPFYRRAEEVCKVHFERDLDLWENREAPILFAGGEGLSTRVFGFGYPQDFGKIYRSELVGADNIHLFLNANATEIEQGRDSDTVVGLKVATLNGRKFRAFAKVFVLAAGGIENPRLLLASDSVETKGVGNRNDLVGRFFMDHPYFFSGHFEPAHPGHERNAHLVEDYERVGSDQKGVVLFALSEDLMRQERLANCGGFFIRRPLYKTEPAYLSGTGRSFIHVFDVLKHTELPNRGTGGHLKEVLSHPKQVAALLRARMDHRRRPQLRQALRIQLEPTPNPESRVRLGPKKDRLGMNRVQVDWRLNSEDKRSLLRFHELLAEGLGNTGCGHLFGDVRDEGREWPISMSGGKHHMGTTRMHIDPSQGVVDPDGRVHGLSNLFLAGSSVFPTSGYANPTLTIVALTLRLADHLRARFRDPENLHIKTT